MEFGREVRLDDVEGDVISRYAVLDGNPNGKAQLLVRVDAHIAQFGNPPERDN